MINLTDCDSLARCQRPTHLPRADLCTGVRPRSTPVPSPAAAGGATELCARDGMGCLTGSAWAEQWRSRPDRHTHALIRSAVARCNAKRAGEWKT